MPLSTDPDDLIPFSLTLDEQRPEARRPVFLLRFLTVKQLLKVKRLYDDVLAEADDEKSSALLTEILNIGVAGWRNLPIEFPDTDPGGALDEVLTAGEKAELARAVGIKPRLTEHDRKNSGSRSSSSTESSVPAAPTSAETNPTDPTVSPAPPATDDAAPPATKAA